MYVKSKHALERMRTAGRLLAEVFDVVGPLVDQGVTTAQLDQIIAQELANRSLVSQSKGYQGYRHVSCISVNDVVVHGVPSDDVILQVGDVVKIDVCAAWKNYCADMARSYVVGNHSDEKTERFISVAQQSLDLGIAQAVEGNRLFDISAVIQKHIEGQGYGIVRDFAGHGIGRSMHEDPDVPNFGQAGTGMRLRAGMTFAIEPMITQGGYEVYVDSDGWTVKTKDGSLAMHVEDTVLITQHGPEILTRPSK